MIGNVVGNGSSVSIDPNLNIINYDNKYKYKEIIKKIKKIKRDRKCSKTN